MKSQEKQKKKLFTERERNKIVTTLPLTPRQADIVKCLLSCRSDKQIAKQLSIGVPTVRSHLHLLFLKFDAQNRTELVLNVIQAFVKEVAK